MSFELAWNDIEKVLMGCRRVVIRGKPGVGKTTTPILCAVKNGWAFYTITLTDDTSVQECVGHWMPKGGGVFDWHDGPFALGWRGNDQRGGLLVINEITKSSGAVLTELYNFLDDPSIALKTLPSGELIKPGPDFRVVATTNDPFDLLPDALMDRFEARITINKPHPNSLLRLPQRYSEFVERCYQDPNSKITLRDVYSLHNLVETNGIDPRVASTCVFGEQGDDVLIALGVGARSTNEQVVGNSNLNPDPKKAR